MKLQAWIDYLQKDVEISKENRKESVVKEKASSTTSTIPVHNPILPSPHIDNLLLKGIMILLAVFKSLL